MIAGLEENPERDFLINEVVMNDVAPKDRDIAPKDRDIAMVFQNYALSPQITVFENMSFGWKLRKNTIRKKYRIDSKCC